jgi:N-acetylmuramoyl-L-alanine amidase
MKIINNLLEDNDVTLMKTENQGDIISPKYLIFHFTANNSIEDTINRFCKVKPRGNSSAHLVIGRDGRIIQLVPFNAAAWHAGRSQWSDLDSLNQHSIGIELENAGRLMEISGSYVSWLGRSYPPEEVIQATHKNEKEPAFWHIYTEKQIMTSLQLADLLVSEYNLTDILGHDDIAPDRESDPGPAFPLENIRSRVFGQDNYMGRWVAKDSPGSRNDIGEITNVWRSIDARIDRNLHKEHYQ